MNFPILSILILLPMVGVALIMMLNRENQWVIKGTAMAVALLEFIISLPLWFQFDGNTAAMQFVEKYSWVPSYGISYYIGIDGISLLLVLLTTFITPICILACWEDIQDKSKRIHDLPAVPGDRHDRGFSLPGSFSFLCFLGNHAYPHVPFNRCLGKSCPADLCGRKVLHLHHGGQLTDVSGHFGALFL